MLLLAVGVVALTVAGFQLFFFLTDDAFIAFRYVSNRQLGHGYVWNAEPFRPVEGYTSLLWVVLLDVVWSLTGIEPPGASNYVSLLFGLATLFLGYRFLARMELPGPLARHRAGLLALVLLGTVTNRTFLTWLSSGLETALFNFCFVLWIYLALAPREHRGRGWVCGLTLAASLTALSRPDGLLCVVATPLVLAIHLVRGGDTIRERLRQSAFAFPLLVPALHLLWRRWTYGEWLPNTYYAKFSSPWPESGWRYGASFLLEYGLVVWVALALVWIVRRRRISPEAAITTAVVAIHVGYYTFVIGGDHFEYRVYSYLVLPIFVSFVWFAARLGLRPLAAFSLTALLVVLSWPIPWVHYLESRPLQTRRETVKMTRPVAWRFPAPVRFYARTFDTLQAWLIERLVCVRHQEHKVFHEFVARGLPSRREGSTIPPDGRPVLQAYAVGLSGWILPHVNVIDLLGLNDYVIARTPFRWHERREMAHDRRPPPGYLACFKPNVALRLRTDDLPPGTPLVTLTPRVLTDEEITRCESTFIGGLRAGPPSRD